MKAFYQDFKLGILGGGQLGRMLIQACTNFNVHTCVLDKDVNAPCKDLASTFTAGDITDFDTVYAFGKGMDLLTIEIENVNVEALFKLQEHGVRVYPQPGIIDIIKDKRLQKQFYLDNGIPTAEYLLVEDRDEVKTHLEFLPAFNKLGTGGYDGGGVQRLDNEADLEKAFDAPGLLEKLVDFDREISVIGARNARGDVAVFPAVECVFHPEYNLVDYLFAPSEVSKEIQNKAEQITKKVVESFGIVGLLAVEMFVTKEGDVLVNEVAPRPHNSGHQTINANLTSQYEQHLRAIFNLPLGATDIIRRSAMVNLLGEPGYTGPAIYSGLDELLDIDGLAIFLYGKQETRPHRKMGHITILDEDMARLKEKVELVKNVIKVIA
ncbi:MAG: 5-(carboxyamino)imidazole ribonucleotide synthase [Gammaproteobacteria bacterium]|nr:5-(carboxyamino)imidazole ribonucleotide synthase [Gammaproteobacteria bacterium]